MSPRKRSEKPRAKKAPETTEAVAEEAESPAGEAARAEEAAEAEEAEAPEREVSSVDEIHGVADALAEGGAEQAAAQDGDDGDPHGDQEPAPQHDEDGDQEVGMPGAQGPVSAPASREQLLRVIEALVFVSEQVISAQQIARIVKSKVAEIRELMPALMREWEGRGIELVEVANGYQFRSSAACAPFVRDLVSARPVRLTRAQLETLALVAYRQPITRPEIDDVRGVDSGSALKVLLERGLLKILGRKDEAGRPLLYGSTPYFLEFFGMKSMSDLPTLREFTDLTEEHRELFKKKMGEVPEDLGNAHVDVVASADRGDETDATIDDEELLAIAEAAKAEGELDDRETTRPPAQTVPAEAEASADGEVAE